jgi:hypothetical protein
LSKLIPGADTFPSAKGNGTSIPPLPLRERESVISVFRSFTRALKTVELMVVPLVTGWPAGVV